MRSIAVLYTLCAFMGSFVVSAQTMEKAWNVLCDAALNAKNPDHREQAVAAIAGIGPAPQAVKLLSSVLRDDKDAGVRQAAAAALDEMKATEAAPALKAALNDSSGAVAFSAAKALWDLGDPDGRATFIEVLTGERKSSPGLIDSNMNHAKRILLDPKKLTYMGIKEASGPLLGPMSLGMSSVGIKAAHDVMANDKAATARAMAAEYMAKTCDARTVQLLEWAIKEDGDWLVKAASAQGLGKCGTAEHIPLLAKYLDDSHEPLKYQASAAIVRLSLKAKPPATASTEQP